MRLEITLHDDDPVAAAIRGIPAGERSAGIRAVIRLHAAEIPALLGLTPSAPAAAPATASLPAAPALRAGVTPGSASTPPTRVPHTDRAALARRLVSLGARCTKAVAGIAIVGALAFGLPHAARAATPAATPSWTLDLNLASIHTEAWARRQLNQVNPGIGATYHYSRTWALMAGQYKNSYRATTVYAAAAWTPLQIGAADHWHVDAGIAAGLASGYGHAAYNTYAWAVDPADASGWRLVTTRRRYMRNPLSPLMAAGIVRLVSTSGVGLNLLAVPNQGARSTGFIGLQLSIPLH